MDILPSILSRLLHLRQPLSPFLLTCRPSSLFLVRYSWSCRCCSASRVLSISHFVPPNTKHTCFHPTPYRFDETRDLLDLFSSLLCIISLVPCQPPHPPKKPVYRLIFLDFFFFFYTHYLHSSASPEFHGL